MDEIDRKAQCVMAGSRTAFLFQPTRYDRSSDPDEQVLGLIFKMEYKSLGEPPILGAFL